MDINRLDDLKYVRDDGEYLAVGALTRHCDVEKNDLIASNADVGSSNP